MTPEKKAQHTPGPWESVETSTPRVTMLKVYAGKKVIADLVAHPDDLEYQRKTPAEQRANARLFASAPDLLAALERLIEYGGHVRGCKENPCDAACMYARAAISKAAGEQQ